MAYGLELDAVEAELRLRHPQLNGKTINSGAGPIPKEDKANDDIVTINETGKGNSADYLTRRIHRDHPDIAQKMRNGEYRSVRAAALAECFPVLAVVNTLVQIEQVTPER